MMTKTRIIIHTSPDEDPRNENHHLLHPLPPRSNSDLLHVHRSSIDTTDDDYPDHDETGTTTSSAKQRRRFLFATRSKDSPRRVRLSLVPQSTLNESDYRGSDPSFSHVKETRTPRLVPIARLSHRLHSSFSSNSSGRSSIRRRSVQTFSNRSHRRQLHNLPSNSKWRFVRQNLQRIAMMNENYARAKAIERNHRWMHLREEICKQVLEMREMSILQQQYEGLISQNFKTNFDLKSIPIDEVVHVERDGRVFSIGTRDLVLGRTIKTDEIDLDAFAQFAARRQFQVKQNLLKRQQGRTRLKKKIAFSFCFCNLFLIALMCAVMFVCTTKTLIELQSSTFL